MVRVRLPSEGTSDHSREASTILDDTGLGRDHTSRISMVHARTDPTSMVGAHAGVVSCSVPPALRFVRAFPSKGTSDHSRAASTILDDPGMDRDHTRHI